MGRCLGLFVLVKTPNSITASDLVQMFFLFDIFSKGGKEGEGRRGGIMLKYLQHLTGFMLISVKKGVSKGMQIYHFKPWNYMQVLC